MSSYNSQNYFFFPRFFIRSLRRQTGGWGNLTTNSPWVGATIIISLVYIVLFPLGGLANIQNGLTSVASGGKVPAPNPANLASCGGAAYAAGGLGNIPATGCINQWTTLTVVVQDAFAGGSLSGYSCTYWTPSGGFIQSILNTGTNGQCVGTAQFLAGSPVVMEICKDTSACGSADYAQQKENYWFALPCPGGQTGNIPVGGTPCPNGAIGNVPFTPPTSSPPYTLTVNLPITKLAGDAYATNTPNTITIAWPNATTFSSSNTGFCGSGTKSLGNIWNLGFILQVGTSGTVPSNPYGAGFVTGTPVNLPQTGSSARGQLQSVLQVEVKETSSTGTTLGVITGTGPLVKTAQKPASVSDIIYTVSLTDPQATLAVSSGGAPNYLGGGSGYYSFSQGFDCTAIKAGSGVTVTITCDWYVYYSTTYVGGNAGSINSEAVKTSATNTVTVKT